MRPAHSKIYQIINIFRMMFVYHYVIIPFNPQCLPKHAPLLLQGGGIQRGGIGCLRTAKFTLLKYTKLDPRYLDFCLTKAQKGSSAIRGLKCKYSHSKYQVQIIIWQSVLIWNFESFRLFIHNFHKWHLLKNVEKWPSLKKGFSPPFGVKIRYSNSNRSNITI